jgi:FkbM family methyltransferase
MILKLLVRAGAIITDLSFILSPEYIAPQRKSLLATYLRLRLKVFLNGFFRLKEEHFLGYKVTFTNYSLFFEEFRQIFIRQSYYFVSDTDSPVIVDGGGNMGVSVLYFKYRYPKARITVFEPTPFIREILTNNIKANNLSDVTVREEALSGSVGTAEIYNRGIGACGNTLDTNLLRTEDKKTTTSYTIHTTILSTILASTSKIDFCKLDIEGSEGEVINDLAKHGTLSKIMALSLEYHYYPLQETNNLPKLLSNLESAGFKHQFFLDELLPDTSVQLPLNGSYYTLIKAVRRN